MRNPSSFTSCTHCGPEEGFSTGWESWGDKGRKGYASARRAGFDGLREINRKAVKHWSTLYHYLVGMHGRPGGEIRALNPANAPLDPNRARPHGLPQLKEFRGPSPYDTDGSVGSWVDVGTGAPGKDVISLIEYLSGGADRRICADYLGRLVDRLVEVAA